MTFELGISLALMLLATVIIPSVAWLVKEVLSLRNKLVEHEVQIAAILKNCERHQEWQSELQKTISRVDNNVVRLCERNGVQYDAG